MKATLALLLTASVNAAQSPSKTDIGTTFPQWKQTFTNIDTALKDSNSDDTGTTITSTFRKNGQTKETGWYQAYRSPGITVSVMQGLAAAQTSVAGDLPNVLTTPGNSGAFYNSAKGETGFGKYLDKYGTVTAAADANTKNPAGDYFVMCATVNTGDKAVLSAQCPQLAAQYWASSALKYALIQNRLNVAIACTDSSNACHTGTSITGVEGAGDAVKLFTAISNPDIMLAASGQANGTGTDGSEWCSGAFFNKVTVATTTTATVTGAKGFGPKGKCSWQVVADDANTHAPVMELEKAPAINMLVQAIEWYNGAALGTGGVIEATAADASPGYLAKDDTIYGVGNGVFINPVNAILSATAYTTTLADSTAAVFSPNNQDNANVNIPNTIGTAIWYERDAGQGKELTRTATSMMITSAYDVYNAQVTTFNTAKTAYDTDKTAYETAFEAAKKDTTPGTTTVPTRPDMPTAPSAYSGPQFFLTGQVIASPTETWGTTFKTTKTGAVDAVLANVRSTAGVWSYDQAKIASIFHKRISYLTGAQAGTASTIKYVGATFGRLGQGEVTSLSGTTTPSPFLWDTPVTAARPGMMFSLFPEMITQGAGAFADWTVSTTAPTVNYALKPFATLSDFNAPAAPAAATAITVGATQVAAASIVAAAAVASTMF